MNNIYEGDMYESDGMFTKRTISILIVDDREMVCESLRFLLDTFDGFEVVGTAEDGESAVSMCDAYQPDIVLMDLIMPGMSGAAATQSIVTQSPHTKIIGLSVTIDGDLIQEILAMGAVAFIPKTGSIDNMMKTIRQAAYGELSA